MGAVQGGGSCSVGSHRTDRTRFPGGDYALVEVSPPLVASCYCQANATYDAAEDQAVCTGVCEVAMTPSTPIEDVPAKELTKEEIAGIAARTPPYDGVRTWGDLLTVRARKKA